MRRSSVILFMFLAITVLLAHSFIPHTHHEDHICLVNLPCQLSCGQEEDLSDTHPEHYPGPCSHDHNDNKGQCDNCHAGTGHRHQGHGEQGECGLASMLLYSHHPHKSDETCSYCDHNGNHENLSPAITANNRAHNAAVYSNLPFRQKPYIEIAGKHYSVHPGGSRAPPRV